MRPYGQADLPGQEPAAAGRAGGASVSDQLLDAVFQCVSTRTMHVVGRLTEGRQRVATAGTLAALDRKGINFADLHAQRLQRIADRDRGSFFSESRPRGDPVGQIQFTPKPASAQITEGHFEAEDALGEAPQYVHWKDISFRDHGQRIVDLHNALDRISKLESELQEGSSLESRLSDEKSRALAEADKAASSAMSLLQRASQHRFTNTLWWALVNVQSRLVHYGLKRLFECSCAGYVHLKLEHAQSSFHLERQKLQGNVKKALEREESLKMRFEACQQELAAGAEDAQSSSTRLKSTYVKLADLRAAKDKKESEVEVLKSELAAQSRDGIRFKQESEGARSDLEQRLTGNEAVVMELTRKNEAFSGQVLCLGKELAESQRALAQTVMLSAADQTKSDAAVGETKAVFQQQLSSASSKLDEQVLVNSNLKSDTIDLIAKHDREVASLAAQILKAATDKQYVEAELEAVRAAHAAELEVNENALATMQVEAEAAMDRMNAKADETAGERARAHASHLHDLKSAHETNVGTVKGQHSSQLAAAEKEAAKMRSDHELALIEKDSHHSVLMGVAQEEVQLKVEEAQYMIRKHAEQISALQQTKTGLDNELLAVRQAIDDAGSIHKTLTSTHHNTAQQLFVLEKAHAICQADVQSLKADKADLQTQVDDLRDQNSQVVTQHRFITEARTALESELDALKAAHGALKVDKDTTLNNLSSSQQAALQSLEAQLSQSRDECASVEGLSQSLKADKADLQTQVDDLRDQNDKLMTERVTITEARTALESELDALKAAHGALKVEKETATTRADAVAMQCEELQGQLNDYKLSSSECAAQLNDVKLERDGLHESVLTLEGERVQLSFTLSEMSESNSILNNDLASSRDALSQSQVAHNVKVDDYIQLQSDLDERKQNSDSMAEAVRQRVQKTASTIIKSWLTRHLMSSFSQWRLVCAHEELKSAESFLTDAVVDKNKTSAILAKIEQDILSKPVVDSSSFFSSGNSVEQLQQLKGEHAILIRESEELKVDLSRAIEAQSVAQDVAVTMNDGFHAKLVQAHESVHDAMRHSKKLAASALRYSSALQSRAFQNELLLSQCVQRWVDVDDKRREQQLLLDELQSAISETVSDIGLGLKSPTLSRSHSEPLSRDELSTSVLFESDAKAKPDLRSELAEMESEETKLMSEVELLTDQQLECKKQLEEVKAEKERIKQMGASSDMAAQVQGIRDRLETQERKYKEIKSQLKQRVSEVKRVSHKATDLRDSLHHL